MTRGAAAACAVVMVAAGCGGPPGRLETLARFQSGVLAIARAGGDVWVGTGEGLARLPGGRGPAEPFAEAAGLTGGLQQVRWIHPRGDTLVLATGGGVAEFSMKDRKVVRSWNSRTGLPNDSVRWTGESGGRIWAGTIFGASRLAADGRAWKTYRIAQGLPQDHVYRMADDGRVLWASAMNGGLVRFDAARDRFTAIPQVRGLGNKHIYAMAPEPGTGLWLGTAGGVNLWRYDPAGWDEPVCEDGFTDYTVYAVLPAGRSIWFGTAFGLYRRDLQSGIQHRWTADDGLPHDEVVGLLADDGGIVVATRLGVSRLAE